MCEHWWYAQSWRRMRGTAANVREIERVGPGGRHDRVEDQRFDVLRVLLGVLLGDLGAVGGAPQHELFVAPRAAQRLDVGDGVGGGVEGAFGPDLFGAGGDQLPGGAVGAGLFEAVAGERVRVAGAALVEDDQIARVEDRSEQFDEGFGERDRGLAGAACERDHRRARFPDGRAAAADRERDGPRRGPGGVERDGEVSAGEVGAVLARAEGDRSFPGPARAAGARRRAEGRRQERDGELPAGGSHQLESSRSDSGGAPAAARRTSDAYFVAGGLVVGRLSVPVA